MKTTLLIIGFIFGLGMSPSYAPEVRIVEVIVYRESPPTVEPIPLTVPGDYEGHFK